MRKHTTKSRKQTESLYYVYRLKNTINNKSYIGISIDIVRRWQEHIRHALSERKRGVQYIHRALKKYGDQNFIFEVVEFGVPASEITLREQYWISYYNTFNPGGYNLTHGGINGAYQIPTWWNGKLYPSRQTAADAAGISWLAMTELAMRGFTEDCFPDGIINLSAEIEALFFPDFKARR